MDYKKKYLKYKLKYLNQKYRGGSSNPKSDELSNVNDVFSDVNDVFSDVNDVFSTPEELPWHPNTNISDFYLGRAEEELKQSKLLDNSSDSDSDPNSSSDEQVFGTPLQNHPTDLTIQEKLIRGSKRNTRRRDAKDNLSKLIRELSKASVESIKNFDNNREDELSSKLPQTPKNLSKNQKVPFNAATLRFINVMKKRMEERNQIKNMKK